MPPMTGCQRGGDGHDDRYVIQKFQIRPSHPGAQYSFSNQTHARMNQSLMADCTRRPLVVSTF